MKTKTAVLTSDELIQLGKHEETIEHGLRTFIEVGLALMDIRDNRLYRERFVTFEDYCRQRWGIVASRARQLITASTIVANIKSVTDVTPENEAQTRPLAKLSPEQQAEAWQRAVETAPNGRITGPHVESVVSEMLGEKPGGHMLVHFTNNRDDWETPSELFERLDQQFNFTLDVCATADNAKCPTFFSPAEDGLSQDWGTDICWMNPPYGDAITDWIKKAHDAATKGALVVCLIPARTDTGWWWDYVIQAEIRFIRGRVRFVGGHHTAPFPSAIAIFYPGIPANCQNVVWWKR